MLFKIILNIIINESVLLLDEPLQVPLLQVRVKIGVMAMTGQCYIFQNLRNS